MSTSPRIRTISSNSAWPGDEGRRDLDDRVTPIVRAADETRIEEGVREEPSDQALALVLGESLARIPVLYELDGVEEAGSAQVADDREVEELA